MPQFSLVSISFILEDQYERKNGIIPEKKCWPIFRDRSGPVRHFRQKNGCVRKLLFPLVNGSVWHRKCAEHRNDMKETHQVSSVLSRYSYPSIRSSWHERVNLNITNAPVFACLYFFHIRGPIWTKKWHNPRKNILVDFCATGPDLWGKKGEKMDLSENCYFLL